MEEPPPQQQQAQPQLPPAPPQQTVRRRAVPLKKRKRDLPRPCSPNESSVATTAAQSYSSLPYPTAAPQVPTHFEYQAGADRGCSSSETIPSLSPPSMARGLDGKQATGFARASAEESSDSGESVDCSVAVAEGAPNSNNSPDAVVRNAFLKKRGKKLPKALRKTMMASQEILLESNNLPEAVNNSSQNHQNDHQHTSAPSHISQVQRVVSGTNGASSLAMDTATVEGNSAEWNTASPRQDLPVRRTSKNLKKQWVAAAAGQTDTPMSADATGELETSLAAKHDGTMSPQNPLPRKKRVEVFRTVSAPSPVPAAESDPAESHSHDSRSDLSQSSKRRRTEEGHSSQPSLQHSTGEKVLYANEYSTGEKVLHGNGSSRQFSGEKVIYAKEYSPGDEVSRSNDSAAVSKDPDSQAFATGKSKASKPAEVPKAEKHRKRCDAFAPVGSPAATAPIREQPVKGWYRGDSSAEKSPEEKSTKGWFKPSNDRTADSISRQLAETATVANNDRKMVQKPKAQIEANEKGHSASTENVENLGQPISRENNDNMATEMGTDAAKKRDKLKLKKLKKKKAKALRLAQSAAEVQVADPTEELAPEPVPEPVNSTHEASEAELKIRKKKKKKKKRAEQLAMEQGNADQSAVVEEKVPVDVPSNQIPAIIANAASDNFADLKSHSSGTYPAKETAETPIERIPKEHKQKASTIATVDVRRSPEEMEFDSVDKDGLSNKKKKANKVKKEQKNKDSSKKMHVAAYLGSSNSDEIRRTSTESASTVASAEASDSDDDESEEEEHLWIQCDACKKWRIVPTTMSGRLPDTWQCRDNRWDPERMNCAVPQQELEEDEYHVRKRADKKKKKEQKRNSSGTEKSSSSGKKSVAPDGVAKRPRGRPPLGKVWDLELGMYVPIDSSNKHAMPTKVKSEKKVTKKASDQSEKVQSAEPKKRKNDFVDSPELTPKPKKKRKSTPKDGKKKVLKKRKLDPIRDRKRMEKLLEIGRREAKAELEKEKSKVMSKLPVEVKNLFGKIGFAKWGRDCLPALALSPYRVPPGAARDAWMNMFRRMRKNGNPLDEICILVHWYGEEDPDNLFSLLEINKFIPYEESTQEIRNYAKAARQKQKLEKKLTRCDKQRIRAMEQLKLDLIKNPWERQPVDFKERDELLTLEDVEEYLEEESDEEEEEEELLSSPEPEPEKAPVDDGYSTLEDSDDDVEDSPNSPVKKKAAKLVSTAPAVPDLQPSDGVSRENPQSPKSLKIKIGKNKMSQIHSSKSADDETRTTEKSAKPELPLSGNVVPSVATPHISGAVDGARLSEPLLNPSSLQAISNPVAGTGDLTDPLAGDLNDIRVEDLVQTVFMNAKGRAEGSALIGTVMHVVNRLREQRDVALQQCAALSVERANLQAARESDGSDAAADNQDRKRPAQKKESGSAAAAPAVDEGGNSHGSNNEEVLKKHKKE